MRKFGQEIRAEDAELKKFIAGKFLDFKMIDSETVLSQVQKLQVIIHDTHAEGMMINESFQVTAFNEKFPPSWKCHLGFLNLCDSIIL